MTLITTAFAQGTHAARPAASSSNQGYYYLETDTNGGTLFQSTGSAWVQLAPGVTAGGGGGGTYPKFAANKGGTNQTGLASGVFTKVTYGTEVYDTNSNYDPATSRFTPTVAGYYLLIARARWDLPNGAFEAALSLYKNGAELHRGNDDVAAMNGNWNSQTVTAIVSLNGTTDYVEVYAYQSSGGTKAITGTAEISYFMGGMMP